MAHAADRVYNDEDHQELPRALRALANEAGVTENGLTLPPRWCHRRAEDHVVDLMAGSPAVGFVTKLELSASTILGIVEGHSR